MSYFNLPSVGGSGGGTGSIAIQGMDFYYAAGSTVDATVRPIINMPTDTDRAIGIWSIVRFQKQDGTASSVIRKECGVRNSSGALAFLTAGVTNTYSNRDAAAIQANTSFTLSGNIVQLTMNGVAGSVVNWSANCIVFNEV